ncbi:hypothetical protein DICVIV_12132 [Dictyocaulus viviparus]|uniref:Uncharacterized protein n=1 Tax=Dictyocaulus viviparus TaxID=29172 RepID=A0A0D8XB89_DICVI|nr:hypothetical protein DICVIV_12132 [Dictyocaulus viviparus]
MSEKFSQHKSANGSSQCLSIFLWINTLGTRRTLRKEQLLRENTGVKTINKSVNNNNNCIGQKCLRDEFIAIQLDSRLHFE